jgi:inosine-uridine nucleoside N-ribohydrolase
MLTTLKNSTVGWNLKFRFNKSLKTIFVFTDIAIDTDDVMMKIILAALGGYNLVFICTGASQIQKAQYALGVLRELEAKGLDISHISVVAGSDANVTEPTRDHEFNDLPFEMADAELVNEEWMGFCYDCLLNANNKSVSILCVGPMTDACRLVFSHNALVRNKVEKLCLMSDVDVENGEFTPDWGIPMFGTASNSTFDRKAAAALYAKLYEESYYIQTIVLSAHATSQCKVDYDFYYGLEKDSNDHPIARIFSLKQQQGLHSLWKRACSLDPKVRGSLDISRDCKWMNTVFFGNLIAEENYNKEEFDPIGHLKSIGREDVCRFQLYDAMAALALHLSLTDEASYNKLFNPVTWQNLHIIGFNKEVHGIKNSQAVIDKIRTLALNSLNGINPQ